MSTSNSNDLSHSSFTNSDDTPTVEESGLSTTASSSIFNENENVDHVEIENEDKCDENGDEEGNNEKFHDSKIRLSTISLKGVPETAQTQDSSSQVAMMDTFPEEIKFINYQSLKNITNDIYDYIKVTPDVIKSKKSKNLFKREKPAPNKSQDGGKKRKKKVKILKASWRDEFGKGGEGTIEVALKKVESLSVFDHGKSEVDRENLEIKENINFLYKLSYHQNLLKIFGYAVDPSTLNHFLIVQYANGGNLRKFLREHYAELTWNDKLKSCVDLASGLKYIHDNDIIHLALHSHNILHHHYKLLISDLGISKSHISTSSSILPYTDPQYLADIANYQRNKQSDIYALGILMHEISSGRIPYDEYLATSEVADEIRSGEEDSGISYLPKLETKIVREGYRQQQILGTPPEYVALYQQCWQMDPMVRPSTDEVLTRLGSVEVHVDDGGEKVEKERNMSEIEEKINGGEKNCWNVDRKEMNEEYKEKSDRDQKKYITYAQDVCASSGTESGNGLRSVYFSTDTSSYPTDSMIYSLADEESGNKKRRCFRKKKIIFIMFVCWLVIIVVVAFVMLGVFVLS